MSLGASTKGAVVIGGQHKRDNNRPTTALSAQRASSSAQRASSPLCAAPTTRTCQPLQRHGAAGAQAVAAEQQSQTCMAAGGGSARGLVGGECPPLHWNFTQKSAPGPTRYETAGHAMQMLMCGCKTAPASDRRRIVKASPRWKGSSAACQGRASAHAFVCRCSHAEVCTDAHT